MNNEGTRLHGAPLSEAPENELGVVYLFAKMQAKYGVRVDKIHAGFPDCIARKIRGHSSSVIRIEFEYKSANFKTHKHDPNGCDWIVCWEHNWPEVPKHLRVIELRKEFGLGWNVWLNPKNKVWSDMYERESKTEETIPRQAHLNDLLLIYLRRPLGYIGYVHRVTEIRRDNSKKLAKHSGKEDWWATTRKLCKLECPIDLEVLKRHKELSKAGFVRGNLQGRQNITTFWPELYKLIVDRNPPLLKVLSIYAPEKMDGELLSPSGKILGIIQEKIP